MEDKTLAMANTCYQDGCRLCDLNNKCRKTLIANERCDYSNVCYSKLSKINCKNHKQNYSKALDEYTKSKTAENRQKVKKTYRRLIKCIELRDKQWRKINYMNKCKNKICYIKCEKYQQEYNKARDEYIKKQNKNNARNIYWGYVRLNKCHKARIASITGPDGWGAIQAQPTLDNLSGFGINNGNIYNY